MWTSQELSRFLTDAATRQPNQDMVLSGYLNRDAEARDYFESTTAHLRAKVSRHQRASLDEALAAARLLRRSKAARTTAFAFFIRGGHRMIFDHVPLAARVQNSVSLLHIPSLYPLTEIRDNLDRFSLIHIDAQLTTISDHELGAVMDQIQIRAPFGSRGWRRGLVEVLRRTMARHANDPDRPWLLAAPEGILDDASRWIHRPGNLLTVPAGIAQPQVHAIAMEHFRKEEEAQSQRLAHAMLARRRRGQGITTGSTPVLAALNSRNIRTLVLNAPAPRRRTRTEPLHFHDSAVWLAHRQGAHIEVVENSQVLSDAGGSACV